jgi:hypothetical protein
VFVNVKAAELKTRVEKEGEAPGRAFRDWGRRVDYKLGAIRRFVHRDWAWTSLDWASIDEKMTK